MTARVVHYVPQVGPEGKPNRDVATEEESFANVAKHAMAILELTISSHPLTPGIITNIHKEKLFLSAITIASRKRGHDDSDLRLICDIPDKRHSQRTLSVMPLAWIGTNK